MLVASLPVEEQGVDQYVIDLVQYLEETFRDVKACARELSAEREAERTGSKDTLNEGDIVLKRKDKHAQPHGSTRFDSRVDGVIYRIHRKVGTNTYELEKLDGTILTNFRSQPVLVAGDLLVKCDMPE